ncbi:MAG: SGNH/GDSL hydrolase family protein [Acidobacteria bacterium]|nr:SGNH/GDSL hydrolase family protein [Acidobacteriota bacterium]
MQSRAIPLTTTSRGSRPRLGVRAVNVTLGLCVILFALLADWLTSGEPGFGRMQQVMLGGGVALVLVGFLSVAWNLRVLVLLVMSGVSLTAGELTLRAFVGPYFATVYQLDSRYIYKLIPNATKIYRRLPADGGESIVVHVNDRGFRDAASEAVSPEGGKRVVVYGDSYIEGEFSSFEQTFVERLRVHLTHDLRTPVTVVNAGVSGYGPDQEYARIADELPVLAPDLLIVAICTSNDLGDLLRNKMIRLAPEGTLARNAFRVHPNLKARFERAGSGLLLSKVVEKRWNSLMLAIDDNPDDREGPGPWLRHQQADYEAYVQRGDNVVTNLSNDYLDIDVSTMPESEAVRYKLGLMRALFAAIKQTAAARGVPLLFVIIPSATDVCRSCEGVRKETVAFPDYRRSATTERAVELARSVSVPFVNLYEPFRTSDPDALYFKQDTHWNDRGQEIAARGVSRYISSAGILR